MNSFANSLVLFLAISIILIACGGSSSKRLARGSYGSAISKSVKALQKDPGDLAELDVLRKAYDENLVQSNSVIERLLAQNNGEALMGVVSEYRKLERVSNQINSLPNNLSSSFGLKNYSEDIQAYTARASDMTFAEAESLLQSPVKEDQRLACEKFRAIRSINPQYPEINRWIEEAEEQAITKILIRIEDKSKYKFRDTLVAYLDKRKLSELNSDQWQRYSLYDNGKFDGQVKINIHKIGIEKNTSGTETHNYEKEIKSPEYVKDASGNVKKDADGNDMRTYTIKKVKAKVVQEDINYDVILRGAISYFDYYKNAEIESEELLQKKTITKTHYQLSGDQEALDETLIAEIDASKNMKEPSEKQLVKEQMRSWRDHVYDEIKRSKKMFR